MKTNIRCMDKLGLDTLVELEGFRSKPYRDSKFIWTIGCGTTILPDGSRVTFNTPAITKEQAIVYMNTYLNEIYKWLDNNLQWQPNQNQYSAICCFLYNVGIGSTLDKCKNTKRYLIQGNIPLLLMGMMSVNNKGLLINRRSKEISLFKKEVKL